MSNIQKFESGAVQVKKELPTEEIFRLDYLDGWEETTEAQKAYLCVYFDTFPKRMKACVESGIPQSKYNKWRQTDNTFQELMDIIEQIHQEELEYLEYIESYTDPSVRGRYLKNKNDSDKTPTTKVDIHGDVNTSGAFGKVDKEVKEAEIVED